MRTLFFSLAFLISISLELKSQSSFSWKNPDSVQTDFYKIAIIGFFPEKELKSSFENEIMESLKKEGVNAVESSDILSPNLKRTNSDPDEVTKYLKNRGYGATIMVTVSSVEKKKEHTKGSISQSPTSYYGRFGQYYRTAYRKKWGQNHFKQERKFYLESNLYDLSEGHLVWLFKHELRNPNSIKRVSKKYAKKLVKFAIKDEILIPQVTESKANRETVPD